MYKELKYVYFIMYNSLRTAHLRAALFVELLSEQDSLYIPLDERSNLFVDRIQSNMESFDKASTRLKLLCCN